MSLNTLSSVDLTVYQISDIDDSADPNYYGYLSPDGSWYIKEFNLASNTLRYVKGVINYSTAWTSRASQTYDYFDAVF